MNLKTLDKIQLENRLQRLNRRIYDRKAIYRASIRLDGYLPTLVTYSGASYYWLMEVVLILIVLVNFIAEVLRYLDLP